MRSKTWQELMKAEEIRAFAARLSTAVENMLRDDSKAALSSHDKIALRLLGGTLSGDVGSHVDLVIEACEQAEKREPALNSLGILLQAVFAVAVKEAGDGSSRTVDDVEAAVRARQNREIARRDKSKAWHERASMILAKLNPDLTQSERAKEIVRAWKPSFPPLPKSKAVETWIAKHAGSRLPAP